MSDLVPFPLRVPKKMKNNLEKLAEIEGTRLGPLARKLLLLGYEIRLGQLQALDRGHGDFAAMDVAWELDGNGASRPK
jgi:hypothetical protein